MYLFLKSNSIFMKNRLKIRKNLIAVGFEPTPTEVDCDLNAAP